LSRLEADALMDNPARVQIERLVALGPLPPSSKAEASKLEEFQRVLESVVPPVTVGEAKQLVTLFGPDDCFGLAWTLLHLIESAPELPLKAEPPSDANEWLRRLWARSLHAQRQV
jgi:hypothetical protein